jgi:hypothetical protein
MNFYRADQWTCSARAWPSRRIRSEVARPGPEAAILQVDVGIRRPVDRLIPLVLGPKYSGMTFFVVAWCVVLLSTLIRDGAANLLYALKRFRVVTFANAVSATAALGATIVLVRIWGGPGAVLGSAVGELLLGAALWMRVRGSVRSP